MATCHLKIGLHLINQTDCQSVY